MIQGIHHITLITADAQRNIDFYTQVLGQRFIKKTVNFDDPGSYHLYFGDAQGSPGSAITFFEWPDAPRGRRGIGGTHHFALTVEDYDGLLKWKRRLTDLGIRVRGPYNRLYFASIYFSDPDGTIVEIATRGPGFAVDEGAETLGEKPLTPPAELVIGNRDEERIRAETWPEPVEVITADMALLNGMHHISVFSSDIQRTDAFLRGLLGMQLVKMTRSFDDADSAHWTWGVDGGKPGTLITYFERDPQQEPRARMGAGVTHHWALSVADEDAQLAWRERMIEAGLSVSPVMDRVYFKSIYTRDPDGHVVEIATAGPGFGVDEEGDALGTALRLPPWYEPQREAIEGHIKPVTVAPWKAPVGT